ncbi:biotin/lipoate A/B protein ligase family protein [Marinicrinis lubricantis]|uniref:Biotin/lipoate A/B protein ligase family protein n=1 Tax=Marinicrinis lubricantis TaxID=2086470 RepID=A0ABW1IW10_9BACL
MISFEQGIDIINVDLTAEQDLLLPFAFEEVLCKQVGKTGRPALHLWTYPKGLVMGLRDRRLPHAAEAMKFMKERGYETIVRHSGGAAVPLDDGVLNVSLILPKPAGTMDFHRDFDTMVHFMKQAAQYYNVGFDVGEVKGSYCPGDYDLSIKGLKFCGIAQRRQTKSFVVHAFIIVEGSGSERAQQVKQFYERAAGSDPALEYPRIRPENTGSLVKLTNGKISSLSDFRTSLMQVVLDKTPSITLYRSYEQTGLSEASLLMAQHLKERYDKHIS